jgi:hypothetical protein
MCCLWGRIQIIMNGGDGGTALGFNPYVMAGHQYETVAFEVFNTISCRLAAHYRAVAKRPKRILVKHQYFLDNILNHNHLFTT